MMKYAIEFSEEKNLLLKETRGICFEDVILAIGKGNIIDNLKHADEKKFPGQRVLVVQIRSYIYVVPYVIDHRKEVIFLKTVYPSRVLTKRYIGKSKKHEKK